MPEDQIQKNIKPGKFEYAGKIGRFLSHCGSDFIRAMIFPNAPPKNWKEALMIV